MLGKEVERQTTSIMSTGFSAYSQTVDHFISYLSVDSSSRAGIQAGEEKGPKAEEVSQYINTAVCLLFSSMSRPYGSPVSLLRG